MTNGRTAESKKTDFICARISRYYSLDPDVEQQQRVAEPVVHVISDPQDLQRLVVHFERLGEGVKSPRAGLWLPYAQIEFQRRGGDAVMVRIDPHLEEWTEGDGNGDHWLKPGFAEFFLDLLKRHEGRPDSSFVRVRIARYYTLEREVGKQRVLEKAVVHEITDAKEVERLVGFFPHLGEYRQSDRAGGWLPYAEIEFQRAKGEGVKVLVDPALEEWTEKGAGKGDKSLATGFADYFLELLKTHEGQPVDAPEPK
ncbi:MAG: hypothetical protein HYS13_06910 [Planctomycetia bacterium]|nr:hypothetical protein [Planctomycetia bacterium]